MELKKIKDLEYILKDCFSNINDLNNLNDIDYLNSIGNMINYLNDFNILIEQIKDDYNENEIKEMIQEMNINMNDFDTKGKNSLNLLQTVYINKLESLLENINEQNVFNKFYIYTELGKMYMNFDKENELKNIVQKVNDLINNNSQDILNGYLNKSLLTYQDCQFINDILINAKENNICLDLTNITNKLEQLSMNHNYYLNVGPKDTLLYIESYNTPKLDEENIKYFPQDLK